MKKRKHNRMRAIEFMTGEAPHGGIRKSSAQKKPPPGKSPESRRLPNALASPMSSKPKRRK